MRRKKKRIRLQQWSLALAIYLACAAVMGVMARLGVVSGASVMIWLAWVFSGVGIFYVLLRSGWSERFADAALTEPQIVFGLCTVLLGYWIDSEIPYLGPIPLMVILNFGAFSLDWRRMAVLTSFHSCCWQAQRPCCTTGTRDVTTRWSTSPPC